jgi:putative ABC transport system ATP-binding protein
MLIRMKDLGKVYSMGDGRLTVLKRINLEVAAGEFIAIMGRSGSGKSSLLHLLGCLDLPSTGTYELKGKLITALNDKELSSIRNTQIGFIFQTFNLIPQLNVLENVEVPVHYSGVVKRERRKPRFRFIKSVGFTERRRSLQLLEKVGLSGRLHHRPTQLSGGEMQRVAIARSLINNPPLLLADEPTGNLDTATAAGIMDLLAELNRQGRTIIMVTHDQTVAAYAETVLHLQDGILER